MINTMTTTTNTMTIATIHNSFTGYYRRIRTDGMPTVSTIRDHLSKAKAIGCRSTTTILIAGTPYELANFGNGDQLVAM